MLPFGNVYCWAADPLILRVVGTWPVLLTGIGNNTLVWLVSMLTTYTFLGMVAHSIPFTGVPAKVFCLVGKYDYVPLTLLQTKTCAILKAVTSLLLDPISGALVAAEVQADRTGELDIDPIEWRSCLELLALTVAKIHGDVMGDLWKKHCVNCVSIGSAISWHLAMAYNINFCQAVLSQESLDISVYDHHCLEVVCSQLAFQDSENQLKVNMCALLSSSLLGQSGSTPRSRTAGTTPYQRDNGQCFHCRAAGCHPSSCSTYKTITGQQCTKLANDQKYLNKLISSSGRPICFVFACSSTCSWVECPGSHECSLCGPSDHGARNCTHGI
ncbi:hypothetical protein GYMLUDRAFT_61948 [Collybiopsis luxurians FD-317 M1]|uniref:Uncharacterized protein n=1 Tax=Collybiopsis luxurians FD-317 M1 TaxID=944289 RepID=A0A0D0BNH3_9AGAR|nr:hypothetical protein GYMLUDRAFT_61948 [Collybiopsis luxurians FD-317 M1]